MIKKFLLNELLAVGVFVLACFGFILVMFMIAVYGFGALVGSRYNLEYQSDADYSWMHCKSMCKILVEVVLAPFRYIKNGFVELAEDIRKRGSWRSCVK